MTSLFYPDISSHQAPPDQASVLSLKGATAVCVKATEGTGYTNPYYAHWKAEAAAEGVFFWAYHLLHVGNAAAQARYCYSVVGKGTGLMVDFEPTTGSAPRLADLTEFVGTYRSLNGTCWFAYVPRWYWQRLGSPSLTSLADRGLLLVSSEYTAYSDTGPGWQPYGGLTPVVWQYADKQLFNGQQVDFNAFKGDLTHFRSLVLTGKPPATAWTPGHVAHAAWSKVMDDPKLPWWGKLTAREQRAWEEAAQAGAKAIQEVAAKAVQPAAAAPAPEEAP